jgi:hypothetical protein
MNESERTQWVLNDEGLYDWWQEEGGSVQSFVRRNRVELDLLITRTLDGERQTHTYPMRRV